MSWRFFAVLILACALALPAQAASSWANLASPEFMRIDTRDLPEAAVMTLAQDRAGFVWIGTQGGLARFDGYRYKNFLPDPTDPNALPDGLIRALLPGAHNGLWIGTSTSGLVHYDGGSGTFRTLHPDRTGRTGPRSTQINALAADGARIWVGGDAGLDLFDPQSERFVQAPLGPGDQPEVWSVLVDREGTAWAATQKGLYYRPADALRFRKFVLSAAKRAPVTYSLYEDSRGSLWAGSVNAVYVIDRARKHVRVLRTTPQSSSIAPGQQWSIIETRPGTMWIGTDNAISIVDAASGAVRRVAPDPQNPGGLTGGRVQQFLRDRSGLIWVANHVGGLLLYNPLSRGLYEISATDSAIGLGGVGAIAVAADSANHLWMGGLRGTLVELDRQRGRLRTLIMPNHAAIQKLVFDRSGTLWIGTTGGLCKLDSGAQLAQCPAGPPAIGSESVYSLLVQGKELWVGGSDGLMLADLTHDTALPVPRPGSGQRLTNTQVRALLRDRRGRLWIGTENGLNVLDRDGKIRQFIFNPHNPGSIGPGGITSLALDQSGRLWAGAYGGPLDVLQDLPGGSMRIRRLTMRDGLPHENVGGLALAPDGTMWAATDAGIADIDPHTLRARAYGLADGVSENAFWADAAARFPDGTIVFGGLDGVTIVAPDASSPWTYAPPIVASTLEIAHRSMTPEQALSSQAVLPAADRTISIEFSALDYSASHKLRYAYRLAGYDRDWTYTDANHRFALYSHLPPGSYRFEVRATNRLGKWSSNPLTIAVRAEPAWYETWWLRTCIAIAIVLLAYGAHVLRTNVLRQRQRELEALVGERTRELSQANAKLQELSINDPLTGLRNRRFLAQHLDTDIAFMIRRYKSWLAHPGTERPTDADMLLFLIDLDHFKTVNDRFGHPAGDAVLMEMRGRLLEVFRDSDYLVRWGGDEFLAIARGSNRDHLGLIADRIRDAIGGRPFDVEGSSVATSASIGFAAFPFIPTEPAAIPWERVVALADQALYAAKSEGRNTWGGMLATEKTNAVQLAEQLPRSEEEAVHLFHLDVVKGCAAAAFDAGG